MQKDDIFEIYKPLRNILRDLNVFDSLRVIWAYANHLQHQSDFPVDIHVDSAYKADHDLVQKSRFISVWNLELLAHEILACSNPLYSQRKTIREWSTMANTVIKLKEIEGYIARHYINRDNVLDEMERSVQLQLPWQAGIHPRLITK